MTPVDPFLAHLQPRFGGAGILVRARDTKRILLLHDPYSGFWTTPGGGIERGESPFDAAVREFHEETEYRGPMTILDRSKFVPPRYWLFFGAVDREFAPVLSIEHDDYVWSRLDALPVPLHPGLRRL